MDGGLKFQYIIQKSKRVDACKRSNCLLRQVVWVWWAREPGVALGEGHGRRWNDDRLNNSPSLSVLEDGCHHNSRVSKFLEILRGISVRLIYLQETMMKMSSLRLCYGWWAQILLCYTWELNSGCLRLWQFFVRFWWYFATTGKITGYKKKSRVGTGIEESWK